MFTVFCLVVTNHIPPEDGERYNGWGVATIIVVGAGLVLHRRMPYVSLGIVIAGLGMYTAANFAGGPVYLAPLVPLYTIAQRGDRRRTWIVGGSRRSSSCSRSRCSARTRGQNFVYFLAFAGWVGGAVFLGTAHFSRRAYLAELEQRAQYLEESREEEARRRVAEERLRIARDLHDVIAHGIATIHMQSGAALHVLDRHPEQAGPALAAIKELSKQTLDELRSTVGVLRDDDEVPLAPAPGLDQVDTLIENARNAGVAITVDCDARPAAVPAAVDLAAYRIVQEALTNVMRHAGVNATATVTIRHEADAVRIEVVDDGRGAVGGGRCRPARRARHRRDVRTGGHCRRGRDRRSPPRRRVRRARQAAAVELGRRSSIMTTPAEPVVIRVLVADDQMLLRAGLRMLLDAEDDIEVVGEADDGTAAIELTRRLLPDVVVMDIRMPNVDGLAATRTIVADPSLASVHVVVLTTFDLDEYVFEAIRAGATGFLLKDAEPTELLRAIRYAASGESLLAPSVTRRLIAQFAASPEHRTVDPNALGVLTEREREIVALVAGGLNNDEIAEALFISPATARTHVSRAMIKLGARDRAQLVVFAYESGLVAPH